MTTAVQMLGALRRQGWNGWFIHNHSADAEDTLRQLKDPKLVMSPEYAFSVEKLPVFDEIEAAAKKYDVNMPVDKLSLGWASGMVLEAALKQVRRRAPGEAAGDAQHGLNVETARHLSRSGELDEGRSYGGRRASSPMPGMTNRQSVKRITEWAEGARTASRHRQDHRLTRVRTEGKRA